MVTPSFYILDLWKRGCLQADSWKGATALRHKERAETRRDGTGWHVNRGDPRPKAPKLSCQAEMQCNCQSVSDIWMRLTQDDHLCMLGPLYISL
eukprot:5959911-Amphidinium_carterae.2